MSTFVKVISGILVVFFIIALCTCTTKVPTGYTGILTTFGKVEDTTMEAGFHFKHIYQGVVLMDNREQRHPFETQAFSSDIQQVNVIGSVNFSIDKSSAMKLYREVGSSYKDILIAPRVLEVVKSVFSKYSAENLVANRGELSTKIKDALKAIMNEYGINILAVAIEDIDFTDAFTNAVEEKQVAQQTKLRVETEQAQQVSVEKANAERKVIAANADADVVKVNADAAAYAKEVQAKAEAQANKEIAASLTDPLIEYWKIGKWNGSVPQFQAGNGESIYPVIDMTK